MNGPLPGKPTLVIGFPEYARQAQDLAARLRCEVTIIELHRFPDGESLIRLTAPVPPHTIMLRSLDAPNTKLIEIILAAQTARTLGARHITLIAPYLCYMRQDIAFHRGEAISQKIIGSLLGELFDALITIDPHLHRVSCLSDVIPLTTAIAVSAATLLGEFVAVQLDKPVLIGPDGESEQWVRRAAAAHKFEYHIGHKIRHGDRDVEIQLPEMNLKDREIVILDDIASSGVTLATAARKVQAAGAGNVNAFITHALFADGAIKTIKAAGIDKIWSTNTISHPTNTVSIIPLIVEAIEKHLSNTVPQEMIQHKPA